MKKTTHFEAIRAAAKRAGHKTRIVTGGFHGRALEVCTDHRCVLINGKKLGYYPAAIRWFAEFTNSKFYSQHLLKKLGYNVISSDFYTISEYASLRAFNEKLLKKRQYPALIKPEQGLKGAGIMIADSASTLKKLTRPLYAAGINFMVQKIEYGTEYRVLFINNKVQAFHGKTFPAVVGDGELTLGSLLAHIPEKKKDARFIAANLKKTKHTLTDILAPGETFAYHITRKGSLEDFRSSRIPKEITLWTKQLADAVGAKNFGLDVFIDGDLADPRSYKIIEINANPGFAYIQNKYGDHEAVARIADAIIAQID